MQSVNLLLGSAFLRWYTLSYQIWRFEIIYLETDELIALQLTLVPMLKLTAVVPTSVLGIARKPLHNVACVIIVYEQSVSVRVIW